MSDAGLDAGTAREELYSVMKGPGLRGEGRTGARLRDDLLPANGSLRGPDRVARRRGGRLGRRPGVRSTWTGLVERECEVSDSERLVEASAALDRISDLIDDVLAMARQGRDVDATDRITLSTVAESCWRNVDTTEGELRVIDDLEFTADCDRVQQLFENLYRNAIEHCSTCNRTQSGDGVDQDDPPIRVRVGALEDRDGFFVADDGSGIDEDAGEAVFEAGYSTGGDGIGIGLAIVGAHDWSISVTESDRGGARFEVSDVAVERP